MEKASTRQQYRKREAKAANGVKNARQSEVVLPFHSAQVLSQLAKNTTTVA